MTRELKLAEVGKRKLTKKEQDFCARISIDERARKLCEDTILTESKQKEVEQRLHQSAKSPFLGIHSLGWICIISAGTVLTTFILVPLLNIGLTGLGFWSYIVAGIVVIILIFVGYWLQRSTNPSF